MFKDFSEDKESEKTPQKCIHPGCNSDHSFDTNPVGRCAYCLGNSIPCVGKCYHVS